ncbi:hypothetical protein [Bernardetia sp.]|uniref:hypothetical protein n=1 Tax=Bernardetia sp. TaxID=1937974 RepID=UPI0025C0046C|nr:hypothetical protein [Bernardetia sp.]
MSHNQKINLVSILLVLIAIAMIVIGIISKILPPPLTGIGFLLIAWGFQLFKEKE